MNFRLSAARHHRNDRPFRHQLVRHTHAGVQQSAGIIPQIQDHGLHALRFHGLVLLVEFACGLFVEHGQTDHGDFFRQHLAGHGFNLDVGARQFDVPDRLAAPHRQGHVRAFLAADFADRFIQRQFLGILAVDFQYLIAASDARLFPRRPFDRRHDRQHFILHADDDPYAAERPFRFHAELLEHFGVHVDGVRIIEGIHHSLDRTVHQRFRRHGFDVAASHHIHRAHQFQCAVRIRDHLVEKIQGAPCREDERHHYKQDGADDDITTIIQYLHPIPYQGRKFNGLTGVPFCRTSKCRCGPVEYPVEPTRATVCPLATVCPSLTNN